jgi:hypothetical protein
VPSLVRRSSPEFRGSDAFATSGSRAVFLVFPKPESVLQDCFTTLQDSRLVVITPPAYPYSAKLGDSVPWI